MEKLTDEERSLYEKKANIFLESFFNIEYSIDPTLFDNLNTFLDLIIVMIDKTQDYVINNRRPFDYSKVTHSGINEKLTILQNFYDNLKVDFDVNSIVNDGTINIETVELDDAIKNKLFFKGVCKNNENHPSINIHNSDLIIDLFVWAHEITHYRNLRPKRSNTSHLLTEAISFTYELLMIDYLSSLDYNYEAAAYQVEFLRNMHIFLYYGYYTVKIFKLFFETGEVSFDNYKLITKYTDDYDECLKIYTKAIKMDQNIIFNILWYALGNALAIYMYNEYQKDPSFINKIEELNTKINTDPTKDCLLSIGITGFDEPSVEKIEHSLDSFIDEIKSGDDYITTKLALINDYIIELLKIYYDEKSIMFDHIDDSLELTDFLIKELEPFFKTRIPLPEVDKLTKASKEEKISIIKDFYRYLNRNENIDEYLSHADITSFNMADGIDENGDATQLIRASLSGYTTNEEDEKRIGLTETNLLLDSCAWVHEFKHYHNLPDKLRSTESYILTEAVSFTEELIYADYLQQAGYYYDGSFLKYETLNNFFIFLQDAYPTDKLISVFVNKGEVTKEKYQELYKQDDDFEDIINESLTLLTDDADDFKNNIRYSIACALSIYMYTMYKHNPLFINQINEFEKHINGTPFYDCLSIIGLSHLNNESLNIIHKAFDEFKQELTSLTNNKTLKLYDMKYEKVL